MPDHRHLRAGRNDPRPGSGPSVWWIGVGWSSVAGAGPGAAMKLRTRLMAFQVELLLRRANRKRRQQLAADLATYTSQADLNDLYALLDTYPDGQTHEIRPMLCQQQAHRIWTSSGFR
jgi:hypothetical protein